MWQEALQLSGGGGNIVDYTQIASITDVGSTTKSVNFTPTSECIPCFLGVRGGSDTTLKLLEGSIELCSAALTTNTGKMMPVTMVPRVTLKAGITYTFTIEGLGNPSKLAAGYVLYV